MSTISDFQELQRLIETVGLDATLKIILENRLRFVDFLSTFAFGNSPDSASVFKAACKDLDAKNEEMFLTYYPKMDAKGVAHGIISSGDQSASDILRELNSRIEDVKWNVWLDKVEELVQSNRTTITLMKSASGYLLFRKDLPLNVTEKTMMERLKGRFGMFSCEKLNNGEVLIATFN